MLDFRNIFYGVLDALWPTTTRYVGPTFHLHDDGKPPIEYDHDDWWVDQRKWNTQRAREQRKLGKVYRAQNKWYYINRRTSPSQLWTWNTNKDNFKRLR